jgi:hypothetical protein
MKLNLFLLSAATMVNTVSAVENIVLLGTAADYAVLAKSGISTTVPNPSSITGSIAVSPIAATAITGFTLTLDSSTTFSTSTQVDGQVKAADYTYPTSSDLTTAVSDMETAYTDAAARSTTGGFFNKEFGTTGGDSDADNFLNLGDGEIGGLKLAPGVYTFDKQVNITADVIFKGGKDDVFIIKTSKSVKQGPSTHVKLFDSNNNENSDAGYDGPQAQNIFWSVAETFTIEEFSTMEGVLLVKQAVTMKTDSTLNGRILAQTAVVLDEATIVEKKPTVATDDE